MRNIDEMLEDIGLEIGRANRLRQWLLPVDPRAYRSIEQRLLKRRTAPHRWRSRDGSTCSNWPRSPVSGLNMALWHGRTRPRG